MEYKKFDINKLYDKKVRAEIVANPKTYLDEISGQKLADDVKVIVKRENKNTFYFTMPQYSILSDLKGIQAASDCAGTVATIGCVSTLSSVVAIFGTASSIGTASTAGSADLN